MRFFFYAKFRHSVEISYCITQILHEINLEDSRSSKSAILTHLKAQNFEFLHFLKAAMHQISKIQSPINAKNGTSIIPRIDFT